MWIERTPEELKEVESKRLQKRIGIAALVALGVTVGPLIYMKESPGGPTRRPMEFDDWLKILPFTLFLGVIAGWFFLMFYRGKQMVVCPKCDTTKSADSIWDCSCGGTFRYIDEMKWIEP